MANEKQLTDFLRERMSFESVTEFYDRFAGVRIPKRSHRLVHEQRLRILFAALVRVVDTRSHLTDAMAEAVGRETNTSPDHVRRVWNAWNRVGRPRTRTGSARDATTPDSFGW